MLWNGADADKMQSTMDNGFAQRPIVLGTKVLGTKMLGTKQASGRQAATRQFIIMLIASVDQATAILASLRSR